MGDYWFLQQLKREQEDRIQRAKDLQEESLRVAISFDKTQRDLEMTRRKWELEDMQNNMKYESVLPYIILHLVGDDELIICYEEEFDADDNICYPISTGFKISLSELESDYTMCGMDLTKLKEIYNDLLDYIYDNHGGSIIKFCYDDFLYFMREELKEYSSHIEYHGAFAYNY